MGIFQPGGRVLLLGLALMATTAWGWEWERIPGGRSAPLALPKAGKTGFELMPPERTGLFFTNFCAQDHHLTNQILLNGSGLAAGDVDGDGRCDLFFCSLDGPKALYRNLGNWKFEDITGRAGLAGCSNLLATGAVFADLDGDGSLDLVVNSIGGGTHCFYNDGKGRFHESPATGVLNGQRGGTSLTLGDMDGDGDLDLYVANYRTITLRDQPNTKFTFRIVNGQPVVTAINGRPLTDPDLTNRFNFRIAMNERGGTFRQDENGEPDVLYRNEGGGRFAPVPFTEGAFRDEEGQPLKQAPLDWGLSALFRDLNGDGAPDLYVCNDFRSPDRVWINDGAGRFQAIAALALRQSCLSAMGLDVADINRDGADDILVLDMLSLDHRRRMSQRNDLMPEQSPVGRITNRPQYSRNMLYVNRGDGTYAETAQLSGLDATEWSWTPVFLDVDLDGFEDVLIPTGFERDNMNVDLLRQLELLKKEKNRSSMEQLRLRQLFPRLELPNLAFRNLGNCKFSETGAAWGFNTPGIAQGMALADLDNDGDLDVVVNNFNGAAGLYRNDTIAPRVAVVLKGKAPNTHGIGGRIKVTGGPVAQTQQIVCGGRYMSCDQAMRVFAAGGPASRLTIEVRWRGGRTSVLTNAAANQIYELDEEQAQSEGGALKPAEPQPFFHDASALLDHRHAEEPFDDFARQPMLSKRLSQLGPGVSWFDVDGDGWDDLAIGSGRSGTLVCYMNDRKGGFKRAAGAPYDQPVTRDQTAVLGWRAAGAGAVLLAGSANYEDGLTNGGMAREYQLASQTVQDALPGQAASTGPLAMADIDGDGQLELFVGGRVLAGRYPEPASSLIFRRHDGQWKPDTENNRLLVNVGLVSGAVFTDLDGDGAPDLVLACEWGPLKIFRNDHGRLTPWSFGLSLSSTLNFQPSTLNSLTGWWTGVNTGDFDGDGRLDLIAGNWGQNTKYERFRKQPLRLFYGDLDGNGIVETIEAYADESLKRLLPLQSWHMVGAAMPLVRERLGSCMAYAQSSLEEIYGEPLKSARELRANWLETTVFLNRGDHFEARALPREAQMAPAFAVCAADFDGDGREDVFLSQNFFPTELETSRYDAGRGLWLKGDGRGGFQAVPGQVSGITVYGEQRGAAACDFDGDGRVDLAVTQNGAETKLYRNLGAAPGLRVRLIGPAGNPQAIGAAIRAGSKDRLGPAREIHAGAGYWSQDSAVQVFAVNPRPERLWVRWPGGKVTTAEVPTGAREAVVRWAE